MNIMITLKNELCLKDIDNYLKSGVKIVRFNFSHIDNDWFIKTFKYIKEKYPDVLILQDLQGHKIRVSANYKYTLQIPKAKEVCFCNNEYYQKHIYKVPYILIPIDWEQDFVLLFNSEKIFIGNTEFRKIKKIDEGAFLCESLGDVVIRAEKGINFVGLDRTSLGLSNKDLSNLDLIKNYNVDYICLSFVESIKLIEELRSILTKFKYKPKIIAKIETENGYKNIKTIISACDGIMLGRGDLSKETDILTFSKIQKEVVNFMENVDRELIIGTYVLQSMIKQEKPSVSDVTAVQYFKEHKVDTLMLSDEMTIGQYPRECIDILQNLIK